MLAGRPDDGIPHIERAMRLSPREPRQGVWLGLMARAHFTARRYEEAVDWARRAIRRQAAILDPYLVLAASLGQVGDKADGLEALLQCEQIRPNYTKRPEIWYRYADSSDREHFLDGLRKAGWEG